MSEKDKRLEESLKKAGGGLTSTRRNLLDSDVTGLTPSERKDLQKRVLHEQVNFDVKSKEAESRFANSSKDMARDLQYVRGLEETARGDYTVDSRYESASGETRVNIRRNNNTAMMVVAIVIGIVLLFLLNR